MAEKKETAKSTRPTAGPKARKKVWHNIGVARVYVTSSFNNSIITITDDRGNTIVWASSGNSGFKGTKKGTPFAAQMAANNAARKALALGVKQVNVFVRGPGSGRETAIRGLQAAGLVVLAIRDITPIPHDGCPYLIKVLTRHYSTQLSLLLFAV